MAYGVILLYVAVSNKEALKHWHSELQRIPGTVTIRKLSATDSVDQSRPYRDSYDIEVEETNLITGEVLRPLMAAASSAISQWDVHLYRQISAQAKDGIDLKVYPPTDTELIQVGMSPTPESVQDYHAWFDEEHLEMLADVPGWRTGHRYELINSIGNGNEMASPFMSAHTYAEKNGLGGEIWRKSIETPWTKKFLDLISDIAEVTARHEPQNRAYCWFRRHRPLSNLKGAWICGFECYENEAALAEVHRSSQEYKAMRTAVVGENLFMLNSPLIFSQPAADWGFLNLSGEPMIYFATAKEALVLVTTYTTKNHETTATLLDKLSKISDTMRQQDGVFAYYPVRRLDNVETEITIFQGYKSVHAYRHVTRAVDAGL
ncbi:Fc.00g010410.m01.CDS01 [Cosmosporella sp. VM-42]